jgi:hypothetical protein
MFRPLRTLWLLLRAFVVLIIGGKAPYRQMVLMHCEKEIQILREDQMRIDKKLSGTPSTQYRARLERALASVHASNRDLEKLRATLIWELGLNAPYANFVSKEK